MTPCTRGAGIKLQDRDLELLRGLFESRLMTLAHAAALHFDGRSEAAKKRIQKLKAAGLIAERPRRAYDRSILFLTKQAFQRLGEEDITSQYPKLTRTHVEKRARVSDLTIRHELEVMNVKAALVSALRGNETFTVAEFNTWPLLCEFKADNSDGREIIVKPDGFVRIHETAATAEIFEHTFFLEVDRSTETQDHLALKATCYRNYYRRGGFAQRNGQSRSEYESFPFRVLMVFRNAERRNNTAERLLLCNPPIMSQVWLTTMTEVTTNPLSPIWLRPIDYRTATRGSQFDVDQERSSSVYKRQSERETFVEARVSKYALLETAEEMPK
jgi:hypothetical protein